jgi:sulfopyruvate decarboxylase subunit alpha
LALLALREPSRYAKLAATGQPPNITLGEKADVDNLVAAEAGQQSISGRSIIAALKSAGIDFVISVPDITTGEGLLRPLAQGAGPRLIRICKEDEGVGIASGLSFCGKRAILLIQQTGLMDSLNAVRATACEYGLPICFMVGLLEKEVGVSPYESKKFGIRIVPQIMDVMGITHRTLETEDQVEHIKPAIDAAYAASKPTVLFLGRRPVA